MNDTLPKVGDKLRVTLTSVARKGGVKLLPGRESTQVITHVYTDGKVHTSSGDTWSVQKCSTGWFTTS